MSENCEPYYLLHRIKILESGYNELVKYIDDIYDEIEELKKKLKKKRTESSALATENRKPR